ncbi:MAG: hypothetical protein ABIG34_04265 [Candidatus Peregrinibacteria bacterium]
MTEHSKNTGGESRFDHVKKLVDACLSAGRKLSQEGDEWKENVVVYGERNMCNLGEFLDKVVDKGCLPPARERLMDLLQEELNLDQGQILRFLGGLGEEQKNILIRTIAESDAPLADRTYSERLKNPDEPTAKEVLLRMLPGSFRKDGARSFGSNILPKCRVTLGLSSIPALETKDYTVTFSVSVKPEEDMHWLQSLNFRVYDEDGKVFARHQKFDDSAKLVLQLRDVADYPEHALFYINAEE